jgi:prepilin-type N-terminal cleavage/methylation domain-containing protein
MAVLRNSPDGFTLMEVLIAMALFTIGVLAVARLADSGIKSISQAQRSFYDTIAGAKFIECLLARPFSENAATGTGFEYDPLAPDCMSPAHEYGSTLEWEVLEAVPAAGAIHVRVTIRRFGHGKVPLVFEYIRAKEFR